MNVILRWFKPNKVYERLPPEFRNEFDRLRELHRDTENRYMTRRKLSYGDLDRQIVEGYTKALGSESLAN